MLIKYQMSNNCLAVTIYKTLKDQLTTKVKSLSVVKVLFVPICIILVLHFFKIILLFQTCSFLIKVKSYKITRTVK